MVSGLTYADNFTYASVRYLDLTEILGVVIKKLILYKDWGAKWKLSQSCPTVTL